MKLSLLLLIVEINDDDDDEGADRLALVVLIVVVDVVERYEVEGGDDNLDKGLTNNCRGGDVGLHFELITLPLLEPLDITSRIETTSVEDDESDEQNDSDVKSNGVVDGKESTAVDGDG